MLQRKTSIFKLLTLLVMVALISVATTSVIAQIGAAETLADFEGLTPPSEFFVFNGGGSSVTTTPITVADSDPLARSGQSGNNDVLEVDYNVTDFGGFGQAFEVAGAQDWSSYTSFDFWFYGTGSGLTYQAEISENRSDPGVDTSERFDYEFTDNTPGWQYISIPFADFTRATDFQPGGAPNDGFTLTEIWAWAIVLPLGADTVYFDDVSLGLLVIDDFESGLPSGTDSNGVPIGFYTFQGAGSSISISDATTPPAPVLPAVGEPNSVLQVDVDSTSYAGFIHGFENDTVDTWISQNWAGYQGFSLWIYGNNSGSELFIDLLESRNPGSTTDDAERWTVAFIDDFSGWQKLEFPFADFTRKGVGNGAPNDGLTLDTVYGWAFGALGTSGPRVYYIDNVALYGIGEVPPLTVGFASNNYEITEGTTGNIIVKLSRPMNEDDPAQVSVDYAVETIIAEAGRDFVPPAAGTLTFVNGGPSELSFSLETLDDNKYEGTERVILRLSNPVDVDPGFIMQAAASIVDNDPFDPLLIDDFERFPDLWDASVGVVLANPEIASGDPQALPDQGAFEGVLQAMLPLAVDIDVQGRICNQGNGVIPVILLSTATFDATQVDHTTVTLGDAHETHVDKKTGEPRRHEADLNGDGMKDLLFHFRFNETGLPCDPDVVPFNGSMFDGQAITARGTEVRFGRDFALGEDWSLTDGMTFYYYGQGTGETITMELLDNRAPDPGPSGWSMVWSDEFNDPAGTPPNPANWGYEIGDGTVNGIPGWGNSELQYYTDSPDNVSTDGQGNLVITAQAADGSLDCYYGPCEYTSARLLSAKKVEVAYGRIESRIQVPDGQAGLWPAFWSLGTDINEVDWPQTGEIDIMEYVSRIPNEIFGTIHGPGYSGGASFGDTYNFPGGVAGSYHTFAIEWQPDLIEWYVDGILYHTATPADVAPNEWVFNDPIFLLFNMAIGGNFGGTVSPDLTFPQEMVIDYVRVYQGPDTAERFETTFVDDFTGWQEMFVPYDAFTRSAEQPDGAPNDGLTLTDVWGYGFKLPVSGAVTSTWLDQVRLLAPAEVTVTNTNDSGPGSLREAISAVANDGLILFDPGLSNSTITLTSGPLAVNKVVTIDGSGAPNLAVSGGGANRVLIVEGAGTATVSYLTLTGGFGWQLAGGVLNNGTLTLDHVAVTNNMMATDGGDFWQGGGGIYNGDGATLNLVDSTVSNNTAGWSGGGVYSFFNTTTTIVRSTISGNVSNDVGGAIRSLGNMTITNSTISSNTATGWHGGAIFQTDGDISITNSTIANNIAPDWAPSTLFIGQFGGGFVPTLTLTNTIITGNQWYACEKFASGTVGNVVSGGHNLVQDDSCNPGASDIITAAAGIDVLADNGGPTLTHALLTGSVAIDAGDTAVCPSTDQRGVTRDAACDIGAYESVP